MSEPPVDQCLALDVATEHVEHKDTVVSVADESALLKSCVEHDFNLIVVSDADVASAVMNLTSRVSSMTEFCHMTDLSHKHVLLHPASGDLRICLDHYVRHRTANTSGCIVMPKWNGLWRKYLKHMQLLKDWESNVELYLPIADRSSGKWPLQVYYDPVHVGKQLGSIAGANKLTMQFQGTVSNAPACVMMDSMCSHTLMGAAFAWRLGITVTPDEQPLQIEVANGVICSSIGTCKVRLGLQQFSAELTCPVVELAKQYELILGEDWLLKHRATLSWEHSCCVVAKGCRKFTLVSLLMARHSELLTSCLEQADCEERVALTIGTCHYEGT